MGETAQAVDARFIVMGSHGRSGWRELLTGSTTTKLVKESKTPLFLYH
jgi:nucleotide-binding universal stress UspA family protein